MSENLPLASVSRGFFCQPERKPTCWTCNHGEYDSGYGGSLYQPPEPAHIECNVKWPVDSDIYLKLEEAGWNEDHCPDICGKYEPRMIKGLCRCGCGQMINAPEYNYPHMSTTLFGDHVPVATIECLSRMEEQYRIGEEQYRRDEVEGF